ncbi:MAG: hypothetical protein HY369_01215 [Candidatus Aenigmarchaeota archaeon]|nr:hypothetical protein [Candidatus Aenigmarchaeota archaeon]
MGQKGVEDFVILLAVALIIIVVGLVFSSLVFLPGDGGAIVPVAEFSPGVVGFTTDFPAQTIVLGDFVVGQTQEQFLKGADELIITAGPLGGAVTGVQVAINPAFLELKRGVRVTFSVLEANPLGNLVIRWNGKEFYNAAPSGFTDFVIPPEYVHAENTLELQANGPGLVFWSATSYKITNLDVSLQYGPQRIVPFDLLPSDLAAFDRGEVDFFGGGPGQLEAKLNGFSIFTGQPQGVGKISFDVTYLNAGNNVLSFTSTATNTLSGGVFRIYSFGNKLVKTQTFTLSLDQVNQVKAGKGRVILTVQAIQKPGVLEVTLNDQPLETPAAQAGENIIVFSTALEGENVLQVTTTGTMDISAAVVGIAP